jgi:hypothetical protein
MNITGLIDEAVNSISKLDGSRRSFVNSISQTIKKPVDVDGKTILEKALVFPVEAAKLGQKIAGVDSGFVGKDLLALDLVLIRCVGVVFSYDQGKLGSAQYFPSFYSFPQPSLTNRALEVDEFQMSKSLQRLLQEVGMARKMIEENSLDYCFIDGSIVPQYADKPRSDSNILDFYQKLIDEFQLLYKTAEEKGCEIVACVEDSRGSRFRTILQERVLGNNFNSSVLDNCYDTILLDYLLAKGERSMAFSYSGEDAKKPHPILSDFDESWSKSIHAFYLRPCEFDRPLRVEFLHKEGNISEHVNRIAGITYALSCLHREYAYPSVLIEADLHARLKPDEISMVYEKIMDKLGKNIRIKMRRDYRPF